MMQKWPCYLGIFYPRPKHKADRLQYGRGHIGSQRRNASARDLSVAEAHFRYLDVPGFVRYLGKERRNCQFL